METLGFIKNLVYNAYEPEAKKQERLESKGGVIKGTKGMSREVKQYTGAIDGLKHVLGHMQLQKRLSEQNLIESQALGTISSV